LLLWQNTGSSGDRVGIVFAISIIIFVVEVADIVVGDVGGCVSGLALDKSITVGGVKGRTLR
jgi:hypothetical protein